MSYVSNYANKPPNAKGISIAVGIHAMVGVGVMMLPGIELPDRLPTILKTYNVIPDEVSPPPEQIAEPENPEVNIPRESKTTTNPLVPDLPAQPDIPIKEFAGLGDVGLGGSGATNDFPIEPLDKIDPVPEPVVIGAKLNSRFASEFQPRYPTGMLRLEEEGVVSVRVLVGTNGRAKDIQLISSPHSDFWDSTRRHALRKWRFKPATKDGKPIESWISLKVLFEIKA